MSDPLVVAIPSKKSSAGDEGTPLTLSQALTVVDRPDLTASDRDELWMQTIVSSAPHVRISKENIAALDARVTVLAFDLDLKDILSAPSKVSWTSLAPAQAEPLREKIYAFVEERFGAGHLVFTANGIHIYVPLPEPIPTNSLRAPRFKHLWNHWASALLAVGFPADKAMLRPTQPVRMPRPNFERHSFPGPHTAEFLASFREAMAVTDSDPEPTATAELPAGLAECEPDAPPATLEAARALLHKRDPALSLALSPPFPAEDVLLSHFPHIPGRYNRTLRATFEVVDTMAGSEFWDGPHLYHILAPAISAMGLDESTNQPYIDHVPRLIKDKMKDHYARHEATLAAAAPAPITPAPIALDACDPFVEALRSHIPEEELPRSITTRHSALVHLRNTHRLVIARKGEYSTLMDTGFYAPDAVPFIGLPEQVRDHAPQISAEKHISFMGPERKEGDVVIPGKKLSEPMFHEQYCRSYSNDVVTFGPIGSSIVASSYKEDSVHYSRKNGDLKGHGYTRCNAIQFYNSKVRPIYNEIVATWLRIGFPAGEMLDEFLYAILAYTRVGDGSTSIPIITGEAFTGKTTLMLCLARRLTPSELVMASELFDNFANKLRLSFLLWIDEKVPSKFAVEKLMTIATGGEVAINQKYGGLSTALGKYRMAITANNAESVLADLYGKLQISDQEKEAIASRLSGFHFNAEAAHYLLRHSNITQPWASNKLDLTVINHLLWEEKRLIKDGKIKTNPDGTYASNGRALYQFPKELIQVVSVDHPMEPTEDATLSAICRLFLTPAPRTYSRVEGEVFYVSTSDLVKIGQDGKGVSEKNMNSTNVGRVLSMWKGLKKGGNTVPTHYAFPVDVIRGKILASGRELPKGLKP